SPTATPIRSWTVAVASSRRASAAENLRNSKTPAQAGVLRFRCNQRTAAQRSGLNLHDYGIADRPAAVAGHAGHPHRRLAGGLAPPRPPLCRFPVLHSEQCALGHLGLAQSGLGADSAAAGAVRDESA